MSDVYTEHDIYAMTTGNAIPDDILSGETLDQYFARKLNELKQLRTQQAGEVVATVKIWNKGGSGEFTTADGIEKLPDGTKLYTHPPAPVPEGYVMVPVELAHQLENLCCAVGHIGVDVGGRPYDLGSQEIEQGQILHTQLQDLLSSAQGSE